jgi:hypothetical protein
MKWTPLHCAVAANAKDVLFEMNPNFPGYVQAFVKEDVGGLTLAKLARELFPNGDELARLAGEQQGKPLSGYSCKSKRGGSPRTTCCITTPPADGFRLLCLDDDRHVQMALWSLPIFVLLTISI